MTTPDQMAAIRQTFFQECDEQLAALEQGLLTMQEGDVSSETVNAVFRAVHSIKGGAGAFKLDALVSFAHVFETALDNVRSGVLVPSPDLLKLMLRAVDVLSDIVAACRDGATGASPAATGIIEEFDVILAELQAGKPQSADLFEDIDFHPLTIAIDDGVMAGDVAAPLSRYLIQFEPYPGLFAKANEPVVLLRELKRLGQVTIIPDLSRIPTLSQLDPAAAYLSWAVTLETAASLSEVQEVFAFVEGDCRLDITPAVAPLAVAPAAESAEIISFQAEVESRETAPVEKGDEPGAAKPQAKAAANATIRVDLERVDRLINLVGELVINQAMLAQRVYKSTLGSISEISTSLEELEHLTRDLQESVMAIRAQPVRPLFQRMSRIVREVAEATGKEVRLKTEGDSTEVDKTVIELLADPLTHMIRNGVDHGLEAPERRLAAGKPVEGVIRLTAAHRSGRVVIEVSDDGAGIDRPKVLAAARRKGLVAMDAQLTDPEIDNLLFHPGFSTATTVSSISGRGVGMDVVKRSIQSLGGRISISSKPQEGSTFSLSLPLTLAVLDGIVVAIGDQTFVIPLTAVVETLQPNEVNVHPLGNGSFVVRVRDSFVPLVDVGVEIGMKEAGAVAPSGVAIMVETENQSRNALLVDSILDQRQVVIKSLETNYGRAMGVAAATILGDGRVAMILDIDSLVSKGRYGNDPAQEYLAKVG
jgi:two-component system chemotaxis sensor kinase CheA